MADHTDNATPADPWPRACALYPALGGLPAGGSATLTQSGELFGTLPYMAPEVLAGYVGSYRVPGGGGPTLKLDINITGLPPGSAAQVGGKDIKVPAAGAPAAGGAAPGAKPAGPAGAGAAAPAARRPAAGRAGA